MTINHPAHGPVSLDLLHQISEILSKAAAQSDGGNLGYAMADAVKVIDGAIAEFDAEPVAYIFKHPAGRLFWALTDESNKGKSDVMPVYAAPRPAPVVPEWTNEQCLEFLSIAFRHAEIKGDLELDDIRLGMKMVNEGRAAMLQAGNHTEQHLDMVVHSGDDNEKADCRLPFDQWLSQQNEPIDVDCGCVTTEAFYHWLRVAYEAGNSPVIPDGYVLVPKEMTPEMMRAVQIKSELGGYAASELSGAYDMFSEFWDVAVSAAP